MWIMIAGPFKTGTDNPEDWAANLSRLNRTAYEVYRRGHVPIVGVNAFRPIIEEAGRQKYDEMMMPLCLELAGRCDAILRLAGASAGADREVTSFEKRGLPVFRSVEEIPQG